MKKKIITILICKAVLLFTAFQVHAEIYDDDVISTADETSKYNEAIKILETELKSLTHREPNETFAQYSTVPSLYFTFFGLYGFNQSNLIHFFVSDDFFKVISFYEVFLEKAANQSLFIPKSEDFKVFGDFQKKQSSLFKAGYIIKSGEESASEYTSTRKHRVALSILSLFKKDLLYSIQNIIYLNKKNLIQNPEKIITQLLSFNLPYNEPLIRAIYAVLEIHIWPVIAKELPFSELQRETLLKAPLFQMYMTVSNSNQTFIMKDKNYATNAIKSKNINQLLFQTSDEQRGLISIELNEFLSPDKISEYKIFIANLAAQGNTASISTYFKQFSDSLSSSKDFLDVLEFQSTFESKSWLYKTSHHFKYKQYQKNQLLLKNLKSLFQMHFQLSTIDSDPILYFMNEFSRPDMRQYGLSRFAFDITIFGLDILNENINSVIGALRTENNFKLALDSELLRQNDSYELHELLSTSRKLHELRSELTSKFMRVQNILNPRTLTCKTLFL